MKLGVLTIWIAATCVALAFAFKPQALEFDFEGSDKLMHFAAFAALAFLPVMTFEKIRNIAAGIVFVMAIGIGIEVVQHYLPTRSADVMDVVFDGIGITAGVIAGTVARSLYHSFLVPAYKKL